MKRIKFLAVFTSLLILLLAGCSKDESAESVANELTDEQLENVVRRSYQYVAMYNVNNNFAMNTKSPMNTGGWNKTFKGTTLADHNFRVIARPNNDTLYIATMLDLRDDAVVVHYPAFDSRFVSLETSAYDHYIDIPLSTTKGDFSKPVTMLYYSDRTEGYSGEAIKGIDKTMKMSGDFAAAFMRIMPHASEPERLKRIIATMDGVTAQTLNEFLGKPAKPASEVEFPGYQGDTHVYKNNFLEVMQFVFNHTSFDPADKMDQGVLSALKPLGVEPGKSFDPKKVAKIDSKRIAAVVEKVRQESFSIWASPEGNPYLFDIFKPKGEMTLVPMVLQSVIGPIGNPPQEAMYPGIVTSDGKLMNAQYDYVIRMSKEQLPPAIAFWSATLYDQANGFFIPNDRKKYIVGENGGMKFDDKGGIAIYIAAEQPEGVPEENWLPINRNDQGLDIIMRVYQPDLDKMKTWQAPKAERL